MPIKDRERYNAYMRSVRRKSSGTKEENPQDPRIKPEHGTMGRYTRYKCRCPRCQMANRDRMRKYRTGEIGPEESLK